jgi:4'-phosphopantetheinyl transferase
LSAPAVASHAAPAALLGSLSREIHVWLLSPDDVPDERLPALEALLDGQERARHGRYLFPQDRRLFALSHGFARRVLSRYAPVAPQDWRFEANEHGRPAIAAPPGLPELRFSLSHVKSQVAVLVATGVEAGVDVEQVRALAGLESVARCAFSAQERQALQQLPEAARPERFFACWTLKEAYAKARGLGLALPFDEISFSFGDGRPPALAPAPALDGSAEDWRFEVHRPDPRHVLSVAVRGGARAGRAVVLRRARDESGDEVSSP